MSRVRSRIEAALADLERAGTLTPAQRALASARIAQELGRDRGLDLTAIVAAFGAVLLAAGFLYLIGYNWELLSKSAKLALVFGIWIGLHVAGYVLSERPGTHPRVGRALTLLGVLAFGGALGLVAQIYHLSARYPHAILAWWGLSVPVVLVTRSRALLVAVIAIGLLWAGWHTGVWLEGRAGDGTPHWLSGFTLVAAALAALLAGLAGLAAGGTYDRLQPVLRVPVLALASAAPFALAFHDPWWDSWPRAVTVLDLAPAGAALAAAAGAVVLVAWRRGTAAARDPALLLAVAVALGGAVLVAPRAVPVLANLALFGGALALVWLGVREARSQLVTWGMLLFVAGVLARYFEYLWDKLEGAYAFLATGSLLLVAAFLFENRRRALAARLREVSR
ncbi:MAG: DUF2157 domain-containing protein [Planctomycetes bacterium]|nr:DUF2157 domain-containing protein [Planctomycetota bacterium]